MVIISIYEDYLLTYKCNYSYINEDGDLADGYIEEEEKVKSSDIIKQITRLITNEWFSDFKIEQTSDSITWYISHFNPMTGEGSDYTLIIKCLPGEIA